MSNTDISGGDLDSLARKICTEPLPQSEMLESSLFQRTAAGEAVSQQMIARESRSFMARTNLIMPPETVAGYIDRRCAAGDLPILEFQDRPMHAFIPMQFSEKIPSNPASPKFDLKEQTACLAFSVECPMLPMALYCLQFFLDDYLKALYDRIVPMDEKVAAELDTFRSHWGRGTNFVPFMNVAVHQVLCQNGTNPLHAFERFDRRTTEKAFDILGERRAFDLSLPPWFHVHQKSVKFSCPAQPFLHELLVEQDALTRVISGMQSMKSGRTSDFHQMMRQQLYAVASNIFSSVAKMQLSLIKVGTPKAYSLLEEWRMATEYGNGETGMESE